MTNGQIRRATVFWMICGHFRPSGQIPANSARRKPSNDSSNDFPYSVIYKTTEKRIRILIVRHDARHEDFGMERK